MKTALVHDWLLGMRGGEKVLEALCGLFPGTEIFTLLHDPDRVSPEINSRPVRTSWLQALPKVRSYYRCLLPLMPGAIESFDLSGYDLVVSSSHCVAKGVRTRGAGRRALHVCYCHTPMRYLYGQFEHYFSNGSKPLLKRGAELFRPFLTRWDRGTVGGVDFFLANSENVRRRIQTIYGRGAEVIYPPVDTEYFQPAREPASDEPYFLVAGALVAYKRVDLAIEACRRLGARLKIVGVGNEEKRLRRLARGADVEFLGWRSGAELRALYQGCAALLFPQEEDFGIAAVEAMACGKPVVAFKAGGALETVIDGATGVLFPEQTAESLAVAIEKAERARFDPAAIRAHAERFDRRIFLEKFSDFIRRVAGGETERASADELVAVRGGLDAPALDGAEVLP